jgi:hypothetical protein
MGEQRLHPHIEKSRAFARDFWRSLGPMYDNEWRVWSYVRNLAILGVWLLGSGGLTLVAPFFGAPLLLLFLWEIREGVRTNRQLWALAKHRRSWPVDIRKRLYQDGVRFIYWGYWRIIDIPELRQLRKAHRTDQLIAFLLIPPIVIFAGLLHALFSNLTGQTWP